MLDTQISFFECVCGGEGCMHTLLIQVNISACVLCEVNFLYAFWIHSYFYIVYLKPLAIFVLIFF